MIAVAAALQVAVVARYADAFTSIQNNIRLTTTSTEELTARTSELLGVANRSRLQFSATAELYTQLNLSTKELNLSTQEQLDLTETIGKAFTVMGKSTEESAGAIRQLGQAFSKGKLNGDEFVSVSEGAPKILQALQDSLGKTRGELQGMSEAGELTSIVLVKAMKGAADAINKDIANSVESLAQSFQKSENNAIKFIGESENINKSMTFAGEAVIALSENLDLLVIAALSTASAYGSKLLISIAMSTAEKIASTASTIALAKAEQVNATSALAVAQAEQRATVAMFNASNSATKASIATNQLALANNNLATASLRANVAQKSLIATTSIAARGLALLGGPAGVIFLAVGALTAFLLSADDAASESERLANKVDDLADSFAGLTRAQIAPKLANAVTEANLLTAAVAKADARVKELASSNNANDANLLLGALANLDKLNDKLEIAEIKVAGLNQAGINAGGFTSGNEGSTTDIPNKKEEAIFVNSELFKTESLKAELAKRLEINRAFNNLMIQDFQTNADKERAIIEFNKEADLADLNQEIIDSQLAFQQKQESLDANQKLSGENRLSIQLELDAQELAQKEIHEIAKDEIERDAALRRMELTKEEADFRQMVIDNANAATEASNRQSFNNILGLMQMFGNQSKKQAIAFLAIKAGVAASSVIMDTQAAIALTFATLGPIAGIGPAAALKTSMAASLGAIASAAALNIGGVITSRGGGGGAFSGGDSSSQPAQRQEPINQNTVVDFRGLEGIAEALANLDPDEVLPAEYTQRIVASLGEYNRLSGGEP